MNVKKQQSNLEGGRGNIIGREKTMSFDLRNKEIVLCWSRKRTGNRSLNETGKMSRKKKKNAKPESVVPNRKKHTVA